MLEEGELAYVDVDERMERARKTYARTGMVVMGTDHRNLI